MVYGTSDPSSRSSGVTPMGLDQYFTAHSSLLLYDPRETARRTQIKQLFDELVDDDHCEIERVICDIGSLRKANQIHRWMVETVQNHQDDCEQYRLTPSHLDQLSLVLDQVNQFGHLAADLLPGADGCFFGSQSVDEWYFQQITQCQKIVERAQRLSQKGWDIYYQASW